MIDDSFLSDYEKGKLIGCMIYGNLNHSMFQEMYRFLNNSSEIPISIIKSTGLNEAIDIYIPFEKIKDKEIFKLIYSPFYGNKVTIYHYPKYFKSNEHWVVFDIGLALDTNAASYVKKIKTFKKNQNYLGVNVSEIVKLRKIKGLQINYLPYLYENTLFKKVEKKKIIETMRACDKFFLGFFRRKSRKKYEIILDYFLKSLDKDNIIIMLKDLFNRLKATVMFIVYIELKYSKRSLDFKISEFLKFYNNEIYAFLLPELKVAKEYFIKKQKLRLFRKIQLNNKEIFDDIDNITWDLFHLRTMEYNFRTPSPYTDSYIPFFLTFDRGILEIKDFYLLSGIAFTRDGSFVQCYHKISDPKNNEYGEEIRQYINKEEFKKRQDNVEDINIMLVIKKYKQKIEEIIDKCNKK